MKMVVPTTYYKLLSCWEEEWGLMPISLDGNVMACIGRLVDFLVGPWKKRSLDWMNLGSNPEGHCLCSYEVDKHSYISMQSYWGTGSGMQEFNAIRFGNGHYFRWL